jgi:GH15 family glucan-1,4-alpha-glucosidase
VARGVGLIADRQAASGAYPACQEFSAYRGYAWFRDGAFTAEAMSRQGEVESASRFHDWCARVLSSLTGQVTGLIAQSRQGRPPAADQMLPTRFTFDGSVGSEPWWDFQLDGYGTWLWAVHRHARRHGLSLAPWAAGVRLTVDYLAEFWNTPCYDWWEEHVEQRHNSTLGAIYAGLMAAAASPALDSTQRRRAAQTAATVRHTILSEGRAAAGHLSKWIGSEAVDASTAACVVPFGVVAPGSATAEATLARIESDLCFDWGTHRFAADVFFGGGQWPLLSCLLGWNQARAGRRDRAHELLGWALDQADDDGLLPEQVDHHLLHPDHQAEWVARWGPVAKPLLWSHAMVLILAAELGLTAE